MKKFHTAEKYISAAAAADVISLHRPGFTPKVGVILGSGLGDIADSVKDKTTIPYFKLPGFHNCTTEGHSGNLLLGNIHGVPVACLQGRAHLYEGIHSDVVKTIIRTLKLLGCETLIITNAVGSINQEFTVPGLMLITDHINFQPNPLIGVNDPDFGPRFPSMDNAYDKDLRTNMLEVAKNKNVTLHQGVYIGVTGPSYESHAEIRAFKVLGADAVGMSTIPEVVVARHCGIKVVAISALTNFAAGLSNNILSHQEVIDNSSLLVRNMTSLILGFIEKLK